MIKESRISHVGYYPSKVVGGVVYKICKERGLGMEIPTDWFLQDIRD